MIHAGSGGDEVAVHVVQIGYVFDQSPGALGGDVHVKGGQGYNARGRGQEGLGEGLEPPAPMVPPPSQLQLDLVGLGTHQPTDGKDGMGADLYLLPTGSRGVHPAVVTEVAAALQLNGLAGKVGAGQYRRADIGLPRLLLLQGLIGTPQPRKALDPQIGGGGFHLLHRLLLGEGILP